MIIRLMDKVVSLEENTNERAIKEDVAINSLVQRESDNMSEELRKSDEKLRINRMNNFPSTSNQTKIAEENDSNSENSKNGDSSEIDDQMTCEEFNAEYQEKQKKKELRKLKKELKLIDSKIKGNNEFLFKFRNCYPVYRNDSIYKWVTILNAYELAEMYSSDTPSIIYDHTIQRGMRTTSKGEEKPLIYTSNVKIILSKMLDGSMDAGNILLNYAKEYSEPLTFNQEDNSLSGKYPLAICDAAHRLESMKIWVKKFKKSPNSIKDPRDFYIPTVIFNLSHSEAENLFVEANSKGKAISRTRLAFHDVFNSNRKIINIIEKQSLLKGRIEEISGTIKKSSNKIITYKTLLDSISIFKPATPKEAEEIGLYLSEFWDELITELFPKSMGNVDAEVRIEQNKQNFVLQNMFISGYFAIAKEIMGLDDWKDRLKKLARNDFLSRSNPIWSFCLREGNKIVNSSKVSKQIGEIMVKHVMEE